jgi:hypothetical protein
MRPVRWSPPGENWHKTGREAEEEDCRRDQADRNPPLDDRRCVASSRHHIPPRFAESYTLSCELREAGHSASEVVQHSLVARLIELEHDSSAVCPTNLRSSIRQ